MANYRITLSILDGDGHKSTSETHVVAANEAAAQAAAVDYANLVDNIILGKIQKITIVQDMPTSFAGLNLKTTAAVGSDREVKGTFLFSLTGGYQTTMSLPTFDKDQWTVVGGAIDGTDGGANAPSLFIAAMVARPFCDYRYTPINGYISGRESFRDLP